MQEWGTVAGENTRGGVLQAPTEHGPTFRCWLVSRFQVPAGRQRSLGKGGRRDQGHTRGWPAMQRIHLSILVQHLKVRWWDFLFPALFRSRGGGRGEDRWRAGPRRERACKMIRLLGCET